MPHIIMECSKAAFGGVTAQNILQNLHDAVGSRADANIAQSKMTSRAHITEHFCIGEGNGNQADDFICITMLLLAGRTESIKQSIADDIVAIIKSTTGDAYANIRVSVNINDLAATYTNNGQ